MARNLPKIFAVLVILGISSLACAQIFKLQGGASTLFHADGGSVQFKAPNYDGQVGLGFMGGDFRFGAVVRTKIVGNTVTVGDETIRFDLPTDVFGDNHFFLARGLGVMRPYKTGTMYVFVGTTSEGFVTPFFSAASGADGVEAVYIDRKISPRLRFASRNVLSRRNISVQAVEWTAQPGVKISVAGGVGSNQRYAASSVDIDRKDFKLKAAYVAVSKQFERIHRPSLLPSETEKENVAVAYRPWKALSLSATHQNIVQPPYRGEDFLHATVNEVSSTINLAKFSFGGGIYHSRIADHSNTGTNLFVTRELTSRLSVAGNLFQSRPDVGRSSRICMASSRYALGPRLSVSGLVSRNDNQTSFGLGGELISNRLSVGVNSQTVYVPLRLDRPFQQAIGVSASAYLFADLRATIASFVAPDGHIRYTFGLSRFVYRQQGLAVESTGPTFHFAKFVVVGVVVDDRGLPVEGAAVHIGSQVVYSDPEGRFMARTDKRGPHAISVAVDEFHRARSVRDRLRPVHRRGAVGRNRNAHQNRGPASRGKFSEIVGGPACKLIAQSCSNLSLDQISATE